MMINRLKGAAIIAVILMHINASLSVILWPAVPIFIILAGYNNTNSYLRNGRWSLRLRRLMPFYFVALAIEIAIMGHWSGWLFILTGGAGPGSYFVPVLLQILVALPVLYWIGRKNLYLMLMVALIATISCEFLGMSAPMYRLCGLRLLIYAAIGVALAQSGFEFPRLPENGIAVIGKYSYQIFLAQMVGFWILWQN